MRTYRATITGDHIEWRDDAPSVLDGRALDAEVLLLEEPGNGAQGKEMAAILAKIASRGGVTGTSDPGAWQREARQDRDLPGRKA